MDYKTRYGLAEKLVAFLEKERLQIPIIGLPINIDGLIGLIPFVGDGLATLVSLIIAVLLTRFDMPVEIIVTMYFYVFLDYVIGSIPLIGDIFDFAFTANKYNLKIAKQYL